MQKITGKFTASIIVATLFVGTTSCGLRGNDKSNTPPTQPDTTTFMMLPAQEKTINECRDSIGEKVYEDPDLRKTALKAYREEHWIKSNEFNERILAVFDRMPQYLQKAFCSYDVILIVVDDSNTFASTASFDDDDNQNDLNLNKNLYVLKIQKRLFDISTRYDLASFTTIYEHSYFYVDEKVATIFPDIPKFSSVKGFDIDGVLGSVLFHESSHVFADYNFPKNDAFYDFSWGPHNEIGIYGGFDYRPFQKKYDDGFAFTHIPKEDAAAYFDSLYISSFISSYASFTKEEDFAETLTYYLIWQKQLELGNKFVMEKPDGSIYDLGDKMQNGSMKDKIAYLVKRLNGELRYKHTFIEE